MKPLLCTQFNTNDYSDRFTFYSKTEDFIFFSHKFFHKNYTVRLGAGVLYLPLTEESHYPRLDLELDLKHRI